MKLDVYIHAQYDEYDKDYRYHVWGYDMSGTQDCGPLVEHLEVDFTPPPREVLDQGTIEGYREQQKAIRAHAERKVNELQQRINDLLCIEYKPEPAETIT